MRIFVLVLALVILPVQVFAAARLVENEGKIFLRSGFLTQIWFSQPLVVKNLLTGDSTKLMIEVIDNVVYVKPTVSTINTDLVIITNNERYHIYLVTAEQAEQYDPDVVLPAAAPMPTIAEKIELSPKKYAFRCIFEYTGDPRLKPVDVFRIVSSTSRKIAIELNPNFPEIPTITAKILGKDVAVNVRYKNNFLIVDNDVFDSFTINWNGIKGEIKLNRR